MPTIIMKGEEQMKLFRCEICHTVRAEDDNPEFKRKMGIPCEICRKVTTHTQLWIR